MTHAQEMAREYLTRCREDLAVAAQRARQEPSKLNDAKNAEACAAVKNAYAYAAEIGAL